MGRNEWELLVDFAVEKRREYEVLEHYNRLVEGFVSGDKKIKIKKREGVKIFQAKPDFDEVVDNIRNVLKRGTGGFVYIPLHWSPILSVEGKGQGFSFLLEHKYKTTRVRAVNSLNSDKVKTVILKLDKCGNVLYEVYHTVEDVEIMPLKQ